MPLLPTAARGTMSCLRPHAHHLSPAVGLALSAGGAHLLSNLYDLEPKVPIAAGARGWSTEGDGVMEQTWSGTAVGALVRSLYHRNHPHEPLRPTANRSLPAAHLSASLCAAVVGLASEQPGSSAVHAALREVECSETGLRLPSLCRETGVSIARFERLVELVAAADAELAPLPLHTGTALVLRLLWLRASSRNELWLYLRALHTRLDVLLPQAEEEEEVEAAFLSAAPFGADELAEAAVRDAVRTLLSAEQPQQPQPPRQAAAAATAAATAFETVAAALALGGSRAAPLNQGRYGFRGQAAVADCAEVCARELLNALLWDPAAQAFDAARLPRHAAAPLRAFYAAGGGAYLEPRLAPTEAPNTGGRGADDARWHAGPPQYGASAAAWFEMASGLPGVPYLSGATPQTRYEVAPSLDAVVSCLGALLGEATVRTPAQLERLWREIEPERGVRLRVNPAGARLYLLEPQQQQQQQPQEEEECTLELVMKPSLNHAFAIHHWRPPAWHRPLAALAVAHAPSLVQQRRTGDVDTLPRTALLPALMQPLLASANDADDGAAAPPPPRWLLRLQFLSTDATDDAAVARSLLRLLDADGDRDGDDDAVASTASDATLGAGLLAAARTGLRGADDDLLLGVAAAAAASGSAALRHATLGVPPLAAPAAVLCGGDGALTAWARAVAASPMRCLRLSAHAASRRWGGSGSSPGKPAAMARIRSKVCSVVLSE